MMRCIIFDSGPLGLVLQRPGYPQADACRQWMLGHLAAGCRVILPEIIDYEIRRELLRLNKQTAIELLDGFAAADPERFLPLASDDLRLAAQLWADTRRSGAPTADWHALDIDVILAAQVLNMGLQSDEFVVATSNVSHLARFVPAREWPAI